MAKVQLPGAFSLPALPPAKTLSLRFGSGLWLTGETFCQSVRSTVLAAWLPSPPSKVEPGSGLGEPASGTASARAATKASAPSAARSEIARTSERARIMRAAGTEPCMRK